MKSTVARIARAHGQSFGGFATAQLEKKLTSSSIAGACTLFTWAVRHCEWTTQDEYKNDKRPGTERLRRLLRLISQRIAEGNRQTKAEHATVNFPSYDFAFQAKDIAQKGVLTEIQKYSKLLRDDDSEAGQWVADDSEVGELVSLSEKLLGVAPEGEKVEGARGHQTGLAPRDAGAVLGLAASSCSPKAYRPVRLSKTRSAACVPSSKEA